MSSSDEAQIRALLDQLVPHAPEIATWDRVLADADRSGDDEVSPSFAHEPQRRTLRRLSPRRRRAPVIALACIAIAVLAPLAALAVGHGWWFLSSTTSPPPSTGVATVTTGTWNGVRWSLTAYRSTTDGICFAITPHPEINPSGVGGAMSCGAIVGARVPLSGNRVPPAVTYLLAERSALGAYILGVVPSSVRRVEIETASTRERISTTAGPTELGAEVRFFATRLPTDAGPVQSIVGLSASGRTIATISARARAIPAAAFARVSNRGTLLHLPPWLAHELRLQHRSSRVWLLASRDGRRYYRLPLSRRPSRSIRGQSSSRFRTCYGTGRDIRPSAVAHTRRGAFGLIGIIECQPVSPTGFPSFHQPVWDMSVYGADRHHRQMHLVRLAGIASDAVKSVDLIGKGGRVVLRVPVVENVYSLQRVPKGVIGVQAADIFGHPLAACLPHARVIGSGSYLLARC